MASTESVNVTQPIYFISHGSPALFDQPVRTQLLLAQALNLRILELTYLFRVLWPCIAFFDEG
jgi:hypothetical protein